MAAENIPVIIGAGQVTKKEASQVIADSPVDLMGRPKNSKFQKAT